MERASLPLPLIARLRALAAGPIARASIASLAIKLAAVGLSLVQAIAFARVLGAEGYGLLASMLSMAQLATTLMLCGLGAYAVRALPHAIGRGDAGQAAAFIRRAVQFVLAVGVLLSLAILLTSAWLAPAWDIDGSIILPLALLLPVLAEAKLAYSILQGLGHASGAQLPGEILRPVIIIGGLGFVAISAGAATPATALWLFLLATLAGLLVSVGVLYRHAPRRVPTNGLAWPDLFRPLLPYFGLSLGTLAMTELGTLLLTAFSTSEQVALYQPVMRLSLLLTIPLQAVAIRFAPRAVELHAAGRMDDLRRIARLFTWTTSAITLVAGSAILLLGPFLLHLFGREFAVMGAAILPIVSAQLINTLCGPVKMLLIAAGRSGSALVGDIVSMGTCTLFGAILIPAYGAYGAVWGLVAAIVVTNAIRLMQVRRALGFWPQLG